MSNDDDATRGRSGAGLPGFSTLSEVFGAAVDGASRMTRTRARHLAERLLNQAGLENLDLGEAASEAGARINQLAEEILAARKANRALLQRTVTQELEKSLHRLGLARADEVQQMREEISGLRDEIAGLRAATTAVADAVATEPTRAEPGSAATAPRKTTATKSAVKKTGAAKRTAGRATTATRAAGTKKAATRAGATKAGATKAGATKAGATKAATTRAGTTRAAKKAAPRKATGSSGSETGA